MRDSEPYVKHPETGKSATRKFIIRFLTSAAGPSEGEDGTKLPATLTAIYDPKVVYKEPLYITGQRDSCKRYVGRASKVASSINPDENLWCMAADVKRACLKLEPLPRRLLALRYFCDFGDYDIANALELTLDQVIQVEADALDTLVSILDGDQ
jgi:hypothetical protein